MQPITIGPAANEAASQARDAYLALEQVIVTLALPPGVRVTESRLIALTGLGRTPVREALQRLAWEGLVIVRPRSGILVTPIDPRDYARVMLLRSALEPILARAAAEHATAAQRERLAACSADMMAAAKAGDTPAFLAADKALDEVLSEAAGNAFLTTALAPLQTHSRRFWFRYAAADGPLASATLHARVASHIVAGNAEAAAQAMGVLMDALGLQAASVSPGDEKTARQA
jgi:DNA-binding GntR family transcriptional regulator